MFLSKRIRHLVCCQKDANKKKATQTNKNDERTAKTHKNPNGKPRPKLQRETNTHDDDKENQSTDSFTTRMKSTTEPRKTGKNINNNTHRKPRD